MDANEPIDSSSDAGDTTCAVRFSRVLSGARPSNSFYLSRRGEIVLSRDSVGVRGFQREFLVFGTRKEFVVAFSDIIDVFQLADFVSLKVVPPKEDACMLRF